MKLTTIVDKKVLQDNFKDYLQPHLQPYCNSKAYDAIVDAFYEYVIASRDKRDEKRQELYHAKEMLEDYAYFEMKRQKGPSMKDCGWGSL
jgi:uncharacterized protein YxeA